MTSAINSNNQKLIHVGRYRLPSREAFVYLREVNPHHYTWFEVQNNGSETETSISAPFVQEAIRLAQKEWKRIHFRPLMCGFRYTLPERDEHGMNALFHQMGASYDAWNGIYFDEDLGHNCFVQNTSEEARNLWCRLKSEGKT